MTYLVSYVVQLYDNKRMYSNKKVEIEKLTYKNIMAIEKKLAAEYSKDLSYVPYTVILNIIKLEE